MIRSFGLYLFNCELRGLDPRNPPEARVCRGPRDFAVWLEDFGHACKAARLGVK